MNIQFEKWHGCSNDFIIINSTYNESKFLKNCLGFELELKKPGRTKIKTAIKKIAGIICSKFIY